MYRIGTPGVNQTGDAQFWSLENPLLNPNYAQDYGLPAENQGGFMMSGNIPPGAPFITRLAPGIGTNAGGAVEVVVPPGGVPVNWYVGL